MRTLNMIGRLSAAALALSLPAAAFAQEESEDEPFNGVYIGGSFGGGFQPSDGGSTILFDRNLDGTFGDTLTTTTGQDAFGPNTTGGAFNGGFCNGPAFGNNSSLGCANDDDGIEYMARIGADTHFGKIVIGAVLEGGKTDSTDSVTAFSTTPAFYTMTRSLKYNGSFRGRIGYAPSNILFYATGGAAYGKVRNRFTTSNGVNSFTTNGSQDEWGYTAGGGVEVKLTRNLSMGLEYLHTTLKDSDARVRVGPGTAPPTNPFLLGNPAGTDFARSDDKFRWNSIRLTAAFRF